MLKLFLVFFGLLCLCGCTPKPTLPSFFALRIKNGTLTKPSLCQNGIQMTLSKGADVWKSPVVLNEETYPVNPQLHQLEPEFIFTGNTKLNVTIVCKNGTETGSVQFIFQAILPIFEIVVDGSQIYEKLVIDGQSIVEVTPEVLPLPSILFKSRT